MQVRRNCVCDRPFFSFSDFSRSGFLRESCGDSVRKNDVSVMLGFIHPAHPQQELPRNDPAASGCCSGLRRTHSDPYSLAVSAISTLCPVLNAVTMPVIHVFPLLRSTKHADSIDLELEVDPLNVDHFSCTPLVSGQWP